MNIFSVKFLYIYEWDSFSANLSVMGLLHLSTSHINLPRKQ